MLKTTLILVLLHAVASKDDSKLGPTNKTKSYDQRDGLKIRFDCEISSSFSPPSSVHSLRPGDINVVAAMGDSMTAGYGIGAGTLPEVAIPRVGESHCIGGDKSLEEGVFTLSNVLKKYNPNLKGYSRGIGISTSANAWLNEAVPGAKASSMPRQADVVIQAMQEDERIDFENDWKMLTLFIGGNDLCQACDGKEELSPSNYVLNIKESLDKLRSSLPKTVVNVISIFDITPLTELVKNPVCGFFQRRFCGCVYDDPETTKTLQKEYHQGLEELIGSGYFDTKDDFTVILHPGLVELDFPRNPDTGEYIKDFLSGDCFHPEREFHQLMALMLWNSLHIPVGEKPLDFPYDLRDLYAYCPSEENPYIYTRLNSNGKSKRKPSLHTILKQVADISDISRDDTDRQN